MNVVKRVVALTVLLGLAAGWARGAHNHGGGGSGGHAGHSDSSSDGTTWEDDHYDRQQKVLKKIMKIEGQLQNPNLSPKKRVKLQRKHEKLHEQKKTLGL